MKQNKRKTGILLVIIFIAGLGLLLYPTISDYWNNKVQTKAIVDYEKKLNSMDENEIARMLQAADNYNADLFKLTSPLLTYKEVPGYSSTLDLTGNGIMGYLTIDKIDVQLPIYHGTSVEVLNIAVGHLQGTSLPVGGVNTHAVLSAHRGLPSAKLFTDLDELDVGDLFEITILNKKITYEVVKILIVKPEEISNLAIEEGKDLCTLLTCTPYGVNTHRLLVIGERTENVEEKPVIFVTADGYLVDSLVVTPIVAIPMLLVLLVILLVRYSSSSKKKREKQRAGDQKWMK